MATLTIRRLDDGAYERLKERARSNERSLEAEARDILETQTRPRREVIADIVAFNERMRVKHGVQPNSLPLLRAIRDEA